MDLESKGAAVRARHQLLRDSDVSSKFFFALERERGKSRPIIHLKRADNTITEDEQEIRSIICNFYQELYTPDPIDPVAQNILLDNLPQLDDSDRDNLDSEITYEELTNAVKQLSRDRTPGIDGLPNEFYQTFWFLIGKDLHQVLVQSLINGTLPLSCSANTSSSLFKTTDC